MKDKKYLLYERSLLTCILMLFICIGLKLFGVPWFNLNTDVPILNEIDRIVMNSAILSFIYSFTLLFINGYLVCIITTKVSDIKKYIFSLSIVCIASILVKTFIRIDVLSFLIDTVGLFIVCHTVKDTASIKEYVIVFILNILYQYISIFLRDITINISYYNLVIGLLFSIDYYIMLIITYLYLKKGEMTLCSEFHHFGSCLAKRLSQMLLNASKRLSESRGGK